MISAVWSMRGRGAKGFLASGRVSIVWLGLGLWTLLLAGLGVLSVWLPVGPHDRHVKLLAGAGFGILVIATVWALFSVRNVHSELRAMRVLAVTLPVAFVVSCEIALYLLAAYDAVSEVGQHILATAIFAVGAVPFSAYVFRVFERSRTELAERARHLQALHRTSMMLQRETRLSALRRLIAEGARSVAGANHSELRASDNGDDFAEVSLSLAVPVRGHGQPVGTIVVGRDGGPEFSDEDRILLDMFAVAASAAVENAHRLEEAQRFAVVEERERIACDLHDDLGQLLGFLTMKIQAVQELMARDDEAGAKTELSSLERAVRMLGTQVREAILGLRVRVGPDRPLAQALREYLADFGNLAGLQTVFEGRPEVGSGFSGPRQYQILRVAQEALSNARRHAHARRVRVRFIEEDGRFELLVADDGVGFDPTAVGAGVGLRTMAERARAIGATFEVDARRGAGTTIRLWGPIEEA